MQRIYAGATASLTFSPVTTGGTYTAKVTDPRGRFIEASASEAGGIATVTIDASAWQTGASGRARVEVIRTASDGTVSVQASEAIRVLPGLKAIEDAIAGAW